MKGPGGVTSSEVMYGPGKILRTGGGANISTSAVYGRSAAVVIDINGAKPKLPPSTRCRSVCTGTPRRSAPTAACS